MCVCGIFLRRRGVWLAAWNHYLLDGSFLEKFYRRESGGKTAAFQKEEALALAVGCGRLAAFAAPLL
jgi:hypothetical protein